MATSRNPGVDRQEEQSVVGANAAAAAVRPQESQIRGSFMPGGGAGENATTLVDADTHAQFDSTSSADEQARTIKQAREAAQAQYEADRDNPDIELAVVPPGADTTNPAATNG